MILHPKGKMTEPQIAQLGNVSFDRLLRSHFSIKKDIFCYRAKLSMHRLPFKVSEVGFG